MTNNDVYTIDLFMWGYQPHFQISVKTAAEGIFQRLDKNLQPSVFLVGILVENRADRHPICMEPEDCGYNVDRFVDIIEQSKHLEAVDEERHSLHSHPTVQENHIRRIKTRALKIAVQQTIRHSDEYKGVISFCSWPSKVDSYQVFVVLQFNRKAFLSHYSLVINQRNRTAMSVSLLDATIQEFLNHCSEALTKPDPGSSLNVIDRDYDEIIRAAGKQFMYTPAHICEALEGIEGLYEACNIISSMKYEGNESIGKMILSRRGHPNVELVVRLINPVRVRDYRAVRKLLEMSSGEICLQCDSAYIYGLGKTVGLYDQRAEDLYDIHFTKNYTWELFHANHLLMRIVYGRPELPKTPINKDKFEKDIKRIFSDINQKEISQVWELIQEAIQQKHGTMVVISTGAKEEAQRLAKQSTLIEPIQLAPHVMKLITAIDGAVLIDKSSTCFAIGVILDGLASQKGTPARGARYNSAIRYVGSSKYPCIAIVISEDGSIDLIPDLMPQIQRLKITEAIEQLKKLKDDEEFDLKIFNKTMGWLSDHKFYLLAEMCNEINSLRQDIEVVRDRLVSPMTIRFIYNDFEPNEEMNETYFFT